MFVGQHAPKDSNPDLTGLEPAVLPLHQGRILSSCEGWNRTNDLLVQSQAILPTASTSQGCKSNERNSTTTDRPPMFRAASRHVLPTESALRESNPPRQVGGLEPLPLGQGHTFNALAVEAGIEPAAMRLTAAFPYQHRTHHIIKSQDGWTRTSDLVRPKHAD